jgi:hypothetical protein
MRTTHVIVGALSLCAVAAGAADAADPQLPIDEERPQAAAPIDYGLGPGVRPTRVNQVLHGLKAAADSAAQSAKSVLAGSTAHLKGAFGAPIAWPIVGIHSALLPDGRVMSFGTSTRGQQGAKLIYDLWDPKRGTGSGAHLVLPNTTNTNIFCSGQTLLATTGDLVMTGGTVPVAAGVYGSLDDLTVFRPSSNTMVAGNPMTYRRWYPTTVALSNGEVMVLGGREDYGRPATTPEVLTRSGSWRALTGAKNEAAFGAAVNKGPHPWFYPRAVAAPNGEVLVVGHDGSLFQVAPTGLGRTTKLATKTLPGNAALPIVVFAPGKVLALRTGARAVVLDLNGATPKSTPTGNLAKMRNLASGTVLADGKVAVTGGSRVYNQMVDVAYAVEIWDPATGKWTTGASAQKPRLYHSSAVLLSDGTVLTLGGGAPGPVLNMNAEIYYPPYLFARDGSGRMASRPSIVTAPSTLPLGGTFAVSVGAGTQVSRVTLVRNGSSTHGVDVDQRFLGLNFTQAGSNLTVTAPADARVAIPGYYMMFVFDSAGVPSVAKMVHLRVPA